MSSPIPTGPLTRFVVLAKFLTHIRISAQVSLLIFDECHHTRKNHAYNGIMRECYQCPVDQRPKIFGMTASPIWNAKDAANSLAVLEKNLNATVVAVRDHATELSDHSPRPKEVAISRL